jgi:hypothetical protein
MTPMAATNVYRQNRRKKIVHIPSYSSRRLGGREFRAYAPRRSGRLFLVLVHRLHCAERTEKNFRSIVSLTCYGQMTVAIFTPPIPLQRQDVGR